ncbi:MAG: hypothetical protein RSC98_07075, partial [Clostridia bacterium]
MKKAKRKQARAQEKPIKSRDLAQEQPVGEPFADVQPTREHAPAEPKKPAHRFAEAAAKLLADEPEDEGL